ncbi:MAG TPA: hypothetical protein VJ482_12575 [Acidimicrobiia bacterium]|nr:hypothetical protein [Acidimicrobiia bacterium]
MLKIEKVDISRRAQVRRFVDIAYRLYADYPNWVPPMRLDMHVMLNPRKHPYYEHSQADFFIAVRAGRDVGRIAALENTRYNEYHKTREGQFYLFECVDDPEAAQALFAAAFEWASKRGLNAVIGPKGFGPFDAYGFLEKGFEHRQTMTMLSYNPPYYIDLAVRAGFRKEVDFVSHLIDASTFELDERIENVAARAKERSGLTIKGFSSKKEIRQWAERIARAYNNSFVDNWEYVPLSDAEVDFIVANIMTVVRPDLIKLITQGERIVGFLLAFPDMSAGMQKAGGRLLPFGVVHLLRAMRTQDWVVANGIGILPEFQKRGGNAFLYSEIVKTFKAAGFKRYELTQIAESAIKMRSDLVKIGGVPHKNHRVFRKKL